MNVLSRRSYLEQSKTLQLAKTRKDRHMFIQVRVFRKEYYTMLDLGVQLNFISKRLTV